jgi:Uma2 family endonuclease
MKEAPMNVRERTGVRRRPWTAKEYYRLDRLGFFLGQRVELIEGEIVLVSPQHNPHAASITLTSDVLRALFGPNFWVRVQMTLDLTPYSVPDPDVAVVPGTPRTWAGMANPTTALLLVESSLTTLSYDRNRKGSLYARVNIADYWILNLRRRVLEVYRNPVPDPARRFGFGYADVTVLSPQDYVTPLALPTARILVADLLP